MPCFMICVRIMKIRIKNYEIDFPKNMFVSKNVKSFGMIFHCRSNTFGKEVYLSVAQ